MHLCIVSVFSCTTHRFRFAKSMLSIFTCTFFVQFENISLILPYILCWLAKHCRIIEMTWRQLFVIYLLCCSIIFCFVSDHPRRCAYAAQLECRFYWWFSKIYECQLVKETIFYVNMLNQVDFFLGCWFCTQLGYFCIQEHLLTAERNIIYHLTMEMPSIRSELTENIHFIA